LGSRFDFLPKLAHFAICFTLSFRGVKIYRRSLTWSACTALEELVMTVVMLSRCFHQHRGASWVVGRVLRSDTFALIGAIALLSGCGGMKSGSFAPLPTAVTANQTTPGRAYKVLYSFRGRDGASPYASPIGVNGTLYGTTSHGGAYDAGTFFKLTTSGKETMLRSFYGVRGALPLGDLINVSGTLYGTTEVGGNKGGCSGDHCGTVFAITTSGKETVLHNFSGADGAEPQAGLIDVKGILYGTTIAGGASNAGTVFSITASGKEAVLHSFGGGQDGAQPRAGLIAVSGTLYGTTSAGGASSACTFGCGTVFSITTSGKEKVLHSFSGADGLYPSGRLTDIKGTLYGTTQDGGVHSPCGSTPCGTVFSMTKSGKETVLHSFSGHDGAFPWAGLTNFNGLLYGTTVDGGAGGSGCAYAGCGTVFSITTSGKETVLHSFGDYGDGSYPFADLVSVEGTLYGTTPYNGVHGYGTVFSLTP
jgi:uncharacterized repeat protein (TIGR03803 family)